MTLENLKIKDLHLLSQMERFESMRSYARHLDIEPQNLSKKIKDIEKAIRTKLFERSTHGITLTPHGQIVIEKIHRILNEIYNLDHSQNQPHHFSKEITVCSRGYLVDFLCPYLIKAFKTQISDTRLQFLDLSPETTEMAGRKNQLSLVYSYNDIQLGKNWTHDKLGKVQFHYVVKNDHPLEGAVDIRDAKKHKFIGFVYLEKNKLISPALSKIKGVDLIKGFDAETSVYTKQIVLNTHQVGLLPSMTIQNELNMGDLKVITIKGQKTLTRTLYMHTHLDKVSSTAYKAIKKASLKAMSLLDQY